MVILLLILVNHVIVLVQLVLLEILILVVDVMKDSYYQEQHVNQDVLMANI